MSANNHFAASLSNKTVWVFDTVGVQVSNLELESREVRCLCFNQNSNILAGFTAGSIYVWNYIGNAGYSKQKVITTS